MVTVYIWTFRGKDVAWGHASLLVNGTYMSWWPEGNGRIASKIHGQVYSVSPIRNRTLDDDVYDEGQDPDHTIVIHGLDERKIKDWWQSFGLTREGVLYEGPLLPWSTLKQNCSTVVARALSIGGGDQYASWLKSWNVVWTPSDVLRYATSIKNGLASAQRP